MLVQTNILFECPRCGERMRPTVVKTAIWNEDRLFVIEDIPAQVCGSCLTQVYDKDTTDAIRRVTEEGFSYTIANREIMVPVFSLAEKIEPQR